MTYTTPTNTLLGHMANSGRKPEVHRGIIYDVMTDSNTEGFVIQTGILSLPLTDKQAKVVFQILSAEYARDKYEAMAPDEKWRAVVRGVLGG